jgi:predicted DNA-binding transcriptional regulator YafY
MYETSTRLLVLLSLLQSRRDWRGADLAERLGVSTRTVRNDVERLRGMGYAIDAVPGPAGGYRLGAGGAAIPPLLLDDEEAVAVAVGLRSAAAMGVAGVEEASVGALLKLEHILPSRLRHRVASLHAATEAVPTPGPRVDAAVLTTVAGAIRNRERLKFDYRSHDDTETRRDVEPHRLVAWGGRWYLVAWDVGRADWRTFRVDRLRPLIGGGPRFVPRPLGDDDAATFVQRGAGRATWRYRARIRLAAPADEVAARLPPAVEVTPDGPSHCVADVGSDSPHMLALWVGMLDVDFEVLSPPDLADAFARLGRRYAAAATAAARP